MLVWLQAWRYSEKGLASFIAKKTSRNIREIIFFVPCSSTSILYVLLITEGDIFAY